MVCLQPVKTYLAIPSKLAGVVIGSKGGYCQFMKKVSGAQRIVVTQDDGSGERLVEIVGTPAQQYFVSCLLSFIHTTILSWTDTPIHSERDFTVVKLTAWRWFYGQNCQFPTVGISKGSAKVLLESKGVFSGEGE